MKETKERRCRCTQRGADLRLPLGEGAVGGSLLLSHGTVVVGLAAGVGVDDGTTPRATSSASATVGRGLVGTRGDHGEVEVGDEEEAPLPGTPNVEEICLEGNPTKP